jgi:hypothetical protein
MRRWSDLGDDSQPDKPKVKRGGIHIPMTCTHCGYEAEAVVNWPELAQMYARQRVTGATMTDTGYVLITLCPRCEKHYRDQGKALDNSQQGKLYRREVSLLYPIGQQLVMQWLALGRRAGWV